MKEEWRDVEGYEGSYQVSNLGNVKSLDRTVVYKTGQKVFYKGIELKKLVKARGYLGVNLNLNKKLKSYTIHRLVAKAFIPGPEDKPEVNHKNGDKTDNRVSNLEWVTGKENIKHAIEKGLIVNRHLTMEEVEDLRKLYKEGGILIREISEKFNIKYTVLTSLLSNETYFDENYTPPKENDKGVNIYFAKFTQDQVDEIRRKYQTGKYTQKELALIYNSNLTVVGGIIRNKKYVDRNYKYKRIKRKRVSNLV